MKAHTVSTIKFNHFTEKTAYFTAARKMIIYVVCSSSYYNQYFY